MKAKIPVISFRLGLVEKVHPCFITIIFSFPKINYQFPRHLISQKLNLLPQVYVLCLATEKGHLLKIHLLEKTARHQNLDCSTLFEQMTKKIKLLEKTPKSHYEQMQVLEQNVNCSNCICSTKD